MRPHRRRTPSAGRALLGALLAVALLFSGDLVRLHGHPDGAPVSNDCVACVAGLSAAAESDAVRPPEPIAPVVVAPEPPARDLSPALPFVRQGGLRDPPAAAV